MEKKYSSLMKKFYTKNLKFLVITIFTIKLFEKKLLYRQKLRYKHTIKSRVKKS